MKPTETFTNTRQEKRAFFQSQWNVFLQSRGLKASLCLLTGAQLLATLCAGPFAMGQIETIGGFGTQRPFWSYLLALLCQLLMGAPGWVTAISLWNIRRDGRWQGETAPEPAGLTWLKKTNSWVCAFGWAALVLYPTVTITAGEYLPFYAVENIFWLFVAITAILVIRVTLVRVVLRQVGENISCCWSNTKLLLPLIGVLLLIAAAGIVCGDFAPVFCLSVSLLAVSYGLLFALYYHCVRKIDRRFIQLDARAAVSHRDPYDDPYTRY